MTIEQKREVIRRACIAANPFIKSRLHVSRDGNLRCRNCGEPDNYENHGKCKKGEERKITLADILLAINKPWAPVVVMLDYAHPERLVMFEGRKSILGNTDTFFWKLTQDNLASQEESAINFLYEILK